MAYPSDHYGLCSNGSLRVVWVLLATMFLVGWTVRPLLYSNGGLSDQAPCHCDCDCDDQFALSLPPGFNYDSYADFVNRTYTDCGKHDKDLSEEMEKNIVALISEEIRLQKIVANDSLRQTWGLIMDTKETSSHYQGEAAKCNLQMEICEEARERAEAELVEERRITELWEKRARDLGWQNNRRLYT
ncbi:hypothetical protein Tsubulata_035431 [Turnera subulata]|uniref:DUF1068 domain-containing protein n=1 Tax=Turnera subulata TaxID=218843 RepID=A0A9Q0FRC1_9ROSI|nr:hypothetical protein Tsubulata_035431 [Turnera subulata]